MDDLADLASAARVGDREALARLVEGLYDRVATLCRRLLVDRLDAEDATQEALVAIVRGLPRFDGRSSITTWAHRVTTNVCLDEFRRRRRRPEVDHHATGADNLFVDDDTERTAERDQIDRALASLRPEFRTAVVLRDVADLEYSEIAELTGVPVGTVRSRIARGREQLAALLSDVGNRSALPDVEPGVGTPPPSSMP